jgi:hypothetical protein
MARAFIIRPFDTKKDSAGKDIDFNRTQTDLIDPALVEVGLGGGTTGEIIDAGNIRADMFALILEADVVVCDLTILNANVFYELGIRHALRKKRTILIKGTPTGDETPFDLLTDRYLPYPIDKPGEAKDKLVGTLKASLASERVTDSPIFQLLPSLPEADPSSNLIIPMDFREEVARAAEANRKGWLRLLSEEVRGKRFEWEGLRAVGRAQWDVKDFSGAKESWETLRDIHPNDVDANLALANIYERLSRAENNSNWIGESDRAIDRVLGNSVTTRAQRAEALSLKGRNQKTRWRSALSTLDTKEQRREHALTRPLLSSYEAYYEAFLQDLNHFYPGLNALQMATILLDLSKDEEAWCDIFDTDEKAASAGKELEDRAKALQALVPLAVEAALQGIPDGDPDRMWAEISAADLLFLTSERQRRVVGAYRDAIPHTKSFAWDAARGQLDLFADLGVKEELAREVIEKIDAHLAGADKKKEPKPVHLVIFAGHRIDEPGRAEPRFPADQEDRAKSLIQEALEKILDGGRYDIKGLASAAPGADILAHEICEALKIPTTLCLAIPPDDTARLLFEDLDAWRNRFLDLQGKAKKHDILYLSNREGLPRWLEGSGLDPWERGNRWVIKMAETSGADRISLIALWDGKPSGDAPGGTAQLVELAREAGSIRIEQIDANQLLQ